MTIPVYLINLDGSDARLHSASEQLAAQGISFERVPAVDGRKMDIDALPFYDKPRALAYMGRPLVPGEIGCYLSHLECARRFLATGAPYGLVLEDDMKLGPDVMDTVRPMLEWLEANALDWDILHLSAERQKIYTPLMNAGAHRLVRAHYFPMVTTGLIWTRKGAESFVTEHTKIWAPVDNTFRNWQTAVNRGLSVVPPLVSTIGAESEIDGGAKKRKNDGRLRTYGLRKQRRNLLDKLRAFTHKLRARG